MIYKTHEIAGALTMEMVLVETHGSLHWWTPLVIIAAGIVGPIADIDKPDTWVSNHIPFANLFLRISQKLGNFIRHRTVTHSLLVTCFLWLLLVKLLWFHLPFGLSWSTFAWALVVGYASHLLIDMLNPEGIQLLWPLPFWIKFLPSPLAIPVESLGEDIFRLVLQVAFIVVSFSFVVVHLHLPGVLTPVSNLAWKIWHYILI